jgi:hypothetical protein
MQLLNSSAGGALPPITALRTTVMAPRDKTAAKESLGLHEMKQHKPWFDEKYLGILDQRKQAKMQWI